MDCNEYQISCQLVPVSQISAFGGFGYDSGWVGPAPYGPQRRIIVGEPCDFVCGDDCPDFDLNKL